MSKKDKKFEEYAEKQPVAKEAKASDAPATPAAPEPTITFDRYFAILGRPAHHKRGLVAFVKSIKGKKTKAEWDRLFQGY